MSKYRLLQLAAMASTVVMLAGCNTVRGVGRDVERAGEVIQGRSAQIVPAQSQHSSAVLAAAQVSR